MLRPLLIAFAFLTRLPVHAGEVRQRDLGRALTCFPLVGAFVGALGAALAWLLTPHLGGNLTALLCVAAVALLTGGLHLDGLADLFDGLGGGRGDRDRMLAIMRDSRIGAHGANALCLTLLGKTLAIGALLPADMPWALFASSVCSRFALVPLVAGFAYARAEGLCKTFHDEARAVHVIVALLLSGLALAPLGPVIAVPCAAALAFALLLAAYVQRTLGGLTGDVYGACVELAELTFLICAVGLSHA
jgi:adenosylcobinamide-GDP ribazoletransferase